MNLQLQGKKAFVFGSSGGIGRAIAESLIAEGAQVLLNSRSEEKLQLVAKEIKAAGYVVGDLTRQGEASRLVEAAQNKLAGLDILVTNTGGPKKGTFLEVTDEQWQEDFQSLWMSAVEAMKVALPIMKKQNFGRILFVTSIAAQEPLPGLTTSNGLRAGLSGLCKSVAQEMAPFGITINALLPGYTNTDRLKELKLSDDKVRQMVPAGRLGKPEELADLACFLSSPRAAYITGQSIAIDGGALRSY